MAFAFVIGYVQRKERISGQSNKAWGRGRGEAWGLTTVSSEFHSLKLSNAFKPKYSLNSFNVQARHTSLQKLDAERSARYVGLKKERGVEG
jgi:hypothetical protein